MVQVPGANDPTVVGDLSGSSSGEGTTSDVDQRIVEAAVRKGLITAIQGTRVLEQLNEDSGVPGRDDSGALGSLLAKGFVSKEAAQDLEDEVKSDFIPGYRLVGELGRGGMGVVYHAVQKRLDRRVALKVVNPNQSGDPGYLKRFRQEALALGKLNHPNIVQVYDYGEAHAKVYLALEFVEGKDGAGVLKDLGVFPEGVALRVVRDAALGLEHANQAGIIHRDIKPANLMLIKGAKEGEWTTKVTDLGLARQQTKDGGGEMTKAGTILGSPAYMAPEQTHGELADFRSDIYALGATLYHLVTGKVPFTAESAIKVIVKKQTELLADPRVCVPDLSEQLVRVLDRMMAIPRDERYQSYEALITDIEAMMAGRAPATQPVPRAASQLEPFRGAATEQARLKSERYTQGSKRFEREKVQEGLDPALLAPSASSGVNTELLAAPARPGGSKAPVVVAVVALALLSGGVIATKGTLWGKTDPVVAVDPPPVGPTTTPPPKSDPAAGVEATIAALAGLPAAERLDPQTIQGALADVAKLEDDGQRRALRLRLVGAVGPALAEVEPERQAKLEALLAQGEYAAMASAVERTLAPYRLLERDAPPRMSALAEISRQAAGDDGKAERALAERLRTEQDPDAVVAAADELARRFPWSPALAAARERVAKVDAETPRVVLALDPAIAALTVDGKPAAATGASRALRLAKGERALRAEAEGYFPLERRLEVAGPLEAALRLNPKPARPLRHDPEAEAFVWNPKGKLLEQWTIAGEVTPRPGTAGLEVEAGAAAWSRATRDIARVMRVVKRPPAALGWRLVWVLVRDGGATEMRLLGDKAGADGGVAVIGVRGAGEVYLGLRRGEALEVLATRAFDPLPGPLSADWDGKVLLVRAQDELVGSVVLPWAPVEDSLEVAVQGGKAEFRDMVMRALIAAP